MSVLVLMSVFCQYVYTCTITFLREVCVCIFVFRNIAYKKLLEYLFWMWDPEMPGGQMEPARIPEEGFMDADTYKVGSPHSTFFLTLGKWVF